MDRRLIFSSQRRAGAVGSHAAHRASFSPPSHPALQESSAKGDGCHRCLFDVIDGHLTEINVTSPTGIRAIARLGGPDVAAKIWDAIEAKRG
jgi:hypothetical protein